MVVTVRIETDDEYTTAPTPEEVVEFLNDRFQHEDSIPWFGTVTLVK